MKINSIFNDLATLYENQYDDQRLKVALNQRREFLNIFPEKKLGDLTIESYAIGKGKIKTFCWYLEIGTQKIAKTRAGSMFKYGIYFSSKTFEYKYTKTYEDSKSPNFKKLKSQLIDLLSYGRECNFDEIESIKLASMVKSKILALYMPDKYIAICSPESLKKIGHRLGLKSKNNPFSIQHELMEVKKHDAVTKKWKPFMYSGFIFSAYVTTYESTFEEDSTKTKKSFRPIDFILKAQMNQRIGEISQNYAKSYEEQRLSKCGAIDVIVKAVWDMPLYGFDILSTYLIKNRKVTRMIEVKTLGREGNKKRVYISAHELTILEENMFDYFVYIVIIGANMKPTRLISLSGKDFLDKTTRRPDSYKVYLPEEILDQ